MEDLRIDYYEDSFGNYVVCLVKITDNFSKTILTMNNVKQIETNNSKYNDKIFLWGINGELICSFDKCIKLHKL